MISRNYTTSQRQSAERQTVDGDHEQVYEINILKMSNTVLQAFLSLKVIRCAQWKEKIMYAVQDKSFCDDNTKALYINSVFKLSGAARDIPLTLLSNEFITPEHISYQLTVRVYIKNF